MTVLATIDKSDHSQAVVDCARRFAALYGTDLQVLHCRPGPDDFWYADDWQRRLRGGRPQRPERAELEAFVDRHLAGQVDHRRIGFRFADPPLADAIGRIADTEQIDLVVLGASHRGRITKLLFETTPEGVVRRCDFPMIVVPAPLDDRQFAAPLVTPIDLDEPHRRSLEYALDLARRADTRLRLLDTRNEPPSLVANGDGEAAARERRRREVERALVAFDLRGVDYEIVPRPGSVIGALLAEAEQDRSGLIILGRREKTTLEQLLFGSTAYRLVRRLPAPILVVPEREEVAGAAIPVFERAFG